MNIRKPADYSAMFAALGAAVAAGLPQMELYHLIGKIICERPEKGAAVAAAEYLTAQAPDAIGFSPRNLRRMRDFHRMYGDTSDLLTEALSLNWTQNVVILEADLTLAERGWYIRQAAAGGLSKAELLRMIECSAHLEIPLDQMADCCYTEDNDKVSERVQHEEDPVYLPRQHLPQPDGRVHHEGLGEEGWAGVPISHRVRGDQPGGDWQPGLSSCAAQVGRAWDHLQRSHGTAAYEPGLRRIRPADRHGQRQPAGYVPDMRRRLRRQDVPPDGPYLPPRQCGRPLVHRGLRGDMAGCAGGVSWLAG